MGCPPRCARGAALCLVIGALVSVADGGPRVVVDAEQEAARLREARARLTKDGGDGRATRPPRGHGPRDGLGGGLSQRPVDPQPAALSRHHL